MVPRALEALNRAHVVVGYRTYMELIGPLLKDQERVASPMKAEIDRARLAVERAAKGEQVAIVSGGDAGIYGMAGLVLEICRTKEITPAPPDDPKEKELELEIIPGVPALAAGAALLGAPLMHDFAAVSLSDLLTPWEIIARRLRLAAEGDFVIVLYNPQSRKRDWQLPEARRIIMTNRDGSTPVGIVRRAMRSGQEVAITNLDALLEQRLDMQTVVFVGNSNTYVFGDYLVTPRGYLDKYRVDRGCPVSGAGERRS